MEYSTKSILCTKTLLQIGFLEYPKYQTFPKVLQTAATLTVLSLTDISAKILEINNHKNSKVILICNKVVFAFLKEIMLAATKP